MRIFRFVMALRMLITSIMHTLKSLFWAMVLLVLIIYAFAVLLAQVVNDHTVDQGESNQLGIDDAAAAERYFGSVQNTMLTLFMSISAGVNWEAVLAPLKTISLVWVFVYLFFIAFTYFAGVRYAAEAIGVSVQWCFEAEGGGAPPPAKAYTHAFEAGTACGWEGEAVGRGTHGIQLALVTRLVPCGRCGALRGRRGAWRHEPSLCAAGVALAT
eukprot:s1481_g8.t3